MTPYFAIGFGFSGTIASFLVSESLSDCEAFIAANAGNIFYLGEAPITVRPYRGPVESAPAVVPDDPGPKSGPLQIAAGLDAATGKLVGLDVGYSFAYAEFVVLSALFDGRILQGWVFSDPVIRARIERPAA